MSSRTVAFLLVAVLLGALGLLGACGPVPEPGGEVVEEVAQAPDSRVELVIEDGLPGESYAALATDGAWCWFGDPRAVFHEGEHRRTFVGFVTSTGDVTLAHYDHDSKDVASAVVAERLQEDDHASPAVLARPDGRLIVFYSGNRGRWMIYRTSTNPEDIASWGKPHAASGHTSEAAGYTYPNAALLEGEKGKRYLFWRGTDFLPMFSVTETGLSWSEPVALIRGDGERPYVKVA
ncbi:BNR-4 repeat-containing protein, partial [bacterium]|nr:BNR-4 repeat-containing protein [bacterium]